MEWVYSKTTFKEAWEPCHCYTSATIMTTESSHLSDEDQVLNCINVHNLWVGLHARLQPTNAFLDMICNEQTLILSSLQTASPCRWHQHNSWFSIYVTYSMDCCGNFWHHAIIEYLFVKYVCERVTEDYKVMAFSLVDPQNLIWCIYVKKY